MELLADEEADADRIPDNGELEGSGDVDDHGLFLLEALITP